METQENQSSNVLGIVGVVCSLGGAIGTMFTQQAAVVIGVGVAMVWFDQNKQLKILAENQQQGITTLQQILDSKSEQLATSLTEESQKNYNDLSTQIKQLQETFSTNLQSKAEDLNKSIQQLQTDQKELVDVVNNLQQIERASQSLLINPNSADFYYQRGVSHERLENKEGAMKDFTEAIKLDPNHAKSYHKRGMVAAELGKKKLAVDDLRKASLLYFEQGDLDNYQVTREMSKSIHDLKTNMVVEIVPTNQVFAPES